MQLLVLNQSEIEQLFPMHECIIVMTDALMALTFGQGHQRIGHHDNALVHREQLLDLALIQHE